MPTPRKKPGIQPIMIEHDGKSLPFKIGLNECCQAEAKFGGSFHAIVQELGENPRLSTVRYLFTLGLSDAENVYSETEAGEIIAEIGLEEAVGVIGESVRRMMQGGKAEAA
ncbi:hypothetical protein [Stakelama pacifica]|uniref:Tail assembly chaperone n=1 Tax=Stakelama pacifica TaxID=517720 RepID=A0A4R6FXW2_9SPHN|nr:hypothetical protein [Stakelama pacifica]TDN86836.1 hypothetical protein EV664_101414 [Stakelama pacifica]GGO90820.1 hypothetical protein GCM10011329_04070 [Stakelama pacifica]